MDPSCVEVAVDPWGDSPVDLQTTFTMLSPGQTIATCQRNISQHCWVQHVACVWPPCCDVLRHVGCCWLKFENGQIWANNIQHATTCRNTVAKRTQQCCDMLRWHVAIVWPGLYDKIHCQWQILQLPAQWSGPWMKARLKVTLLLIQISMLLSIKCNQLAL